MTSGLTVFIHFPVFHHLYKYIKYFQTFLKNAENAIMKNCELFLVD